MWVWLSVLEEKLGEGITQGRAFMSGVAATLDHRPVLRDYRRHPQLRQQFNEMAGAFLSVAAVGLSFNYMAAGIETEPSMLTTPIVYAYGYLSYVAGLYLLGKWGNALCDTLDVREQCAQHSQEKQIDDLLFYVFSEAQMAIRHLPLPYIKYAMLPMVNVLNGMGIHSYGHHPQATERSYWGYFLGFSFGQMTLMMSLEQLLLLVLQHEDVFIIENTLYLLTWLYLIHRSHYSELPEPEATNRIDAFEPARMLKSYIRNRELNFPSGQRPDGKFSSRFR